MVTLTNTLDPWSVHIARGVLEEHGIQSFVKNDAAALAYGALTCGGYELMVEEEDLRAAKEVLNALPVAASPNEEDARPSEAPSLSKALRAAVISGVEIFLLVALLIALPRLISILTSNGGWTFLKPLGGYLYQLPSYLTLWALMGAATGLVVGLGVWLFADFRRRKGAAGTVFVCLLGALLLLNYLVPLAVGLCMMFI